MTDAANGALGEVFLCNPPDGRDLPAQRSHVGTASVDNAVNGSGELSAVRGPRDRQGHVPTLCTVAVADLAELLPSSGVWVLFVGRREMGSLIGAHLRPPHAPASMPVVVATAQKQALRVLRIHSPFVVMLQTDAKPNSRVRFGQMLRGRLPDTRLMAVGPRQLGDAFLFDGYWEPPYLAQALVQWMTRRLDGNDNHVMQRGPIRLDLLTRTVVTPKGSHHMTPKQCALLHMLLDNHDRLVSRQDIMLTIWQTTFMEDTRTLDVHIRWLREVIEPDPSEPVYLRTVRGKGYHLCVEG